jgi:hypothetical protein
MRTKRMAAFAAIPAAAALLVGLAAGPAFAGSPVTCPTPGSTTGVPNSGSSTDMSGVCTATGTITVSQTLALALDFSTFPVYSSSAAAGSSQPGSVYVLSNDAAGYYVSEQVSSFTATVGSNTYTIPGTAVDGTVFSAGYAASSAPFTGSPLTLVASSALSGTEQGINNAPGASYLASEGMSGWDDYGLNPFYENGTQPVVPAGSYAGTWTAALWGN